MFRRLQHRWTLWLLPLLAARALVPIGFMLSVDARGLQLAFCPTQSPALAAAFGAGHHASSNSAAHAHHHEHDATGADRGQSSPEASHVEAPCPYALAAAGMPAAAAPDGTVERAQYTLPLASFDAHSPSSGPIRAQLIRGPPALS